MKKYNAIRLLGDGNMAKVARAVGCSKQAVQRWKVDASGAISSRRVADRVLAALVRSNYQHRADNPDGERPGLDEATLDDLMYLPADATDD
jgi:hypothetical protein